MLNIDHAKIAEVLRNDWNLKEIINELDITPWEQTEPHRKDRIVSLGSANIVENELSTIFEDENLEPDEIDDLYVTFTEALSEVLTETAGREIYAEYESGDLIVGEYKDT